MMFGFNLRLIFSVAAKRHYEILKAQTKAEIKETLEQIMDGNNQVNYIFINILLLHHKHKNS